MKCPFVIKVCKKCKRILVANTINFGKQKGGKWNLYSECKNCRNKQNQTNRKINKRIKEKGLFDNIDINKVWNHCPFCIKVCTKCGEILVANKNNFMKDKKGKYKLSSQCKSCLNKNIKIYKNINKDNIKGNAKKYYRINRIKILNQKKFYQQNNPEKIFNHNNKRRSLEENQGNGISKEQWLEMMLFFDFKCAYSGEYLGGSVNNDRTIDHIIPLVLGGENEIWNIVPMLKSYNSSKNANDMEEWYKQQEFYSEERLNKIYEWIEYAKDKWGGE